MQEDYIAQILTKNYAEKEFELAEGKLKVTLRTLSGREQIDIEEQVSKLEGKSGVYLLHQYSLLLLKKCLQIYNSKDLTKLPEEDRSKFIEELPTGVIDILIKMRDDFQKEVFKLLVPEELEAHFFPQKPPAEESNSLSKGLTSSDLKTPQQNS